MADNGKIDVDGLPARPAGNLDSIVGVDKATRQAAQFPVTALPMPQGVVDAIRRQNQAIDTIRASQGSAIVPYETVADLPASDPGEGKRLAWVWGDAIAENNGAWAWDGGWEKSADRVSAVEQGALKLHNQVEDAVRSQRALPNLFTREQLEFDVLPDISSFFGHMAADELEGMPVLKLTSEAGSYVRRAWRFPRSAFPGSLASASVVVYWANAGAGSPANNFVRLTFRDSSGAQIMLAEAPSAPIGGIEDATTYRVSGATIPAGTAYVDLDVQFNSDGVNPREAYVGGMFVGGGSNPTFRGPDELSRVTAEVFAALHAQQATVEASEPQAFLGSLAVLPSRIQSKLQPLAMSIVQTASGGGAGVQFHERSEASLAPDKTTYFISASGNDANDGLSRGTPKLSLGRLLEEVDPAGPVEIIIIGGPSIFYRNASVHTRTWNKPVHLSIIAESEVLMTSAERPTELSWSANGSAWQATRSATVGVFDASVRDYMGLPIRLTRVASVAEVQATPNSWHFDGSVVTVRTIDGRAPDPRLLVIVSTSTFNIFPTAGKTVYLEGIIFGMGHSTLEAVRVDVAKGDTGFFTQVGCGYFASGGNAISFRGVSLAYSRNCAAGYANLDGFNYHDYADEPQGVAVEVNCRAHELGTVGGDSNNNASTAHDGTTVVRVNGTYHTANGPVVADTGGCISFNVACTSSRSLLSGTPRAASWYFSDSGAEEPGESWLVGCGSNDSEYDISSNGPEVINVRGWRGPPPNTSPGTAVVAF